MGRADETFRPRGAGQAQSGPVRGIAFRTARNAPWTSIDVRGFVWPPDRFNPDVEEFVPREFIRAYEALLAFRPAKAILWTPRELHLEFTLAPADDPDREARPWPRAWPAPRLSSGSRGRIPGHVMVRLPGSRLPELKAFTEAAQEANQVVSASGRRWELPSYWFIIPGYPGLGFPDRK